MHQRSRFSASDASYHSFNDIELYEPPSPPKPTKDMTTVTTTPITTSHDVKNDDLPPSAFKMQRQDSGYESFNPTPRTSTSQSRRPSVSRRISTSSSNGGGPVASRHRSRPCTRRSTKSYPNPATAGPTASPPLFLVRSAQHSTMQHQQLSYFHFPSPEPASTDAPADQPPLSPLSPASAGVPPQTTHYWTSDDTRRLEYAAIDAASRGVKGWIRRNMVPECFVSKESRHVSFDDDTGSVRRYRLELEDEPVEVPEKTRPSGRKRWAFWLSRNNTA